MSARIGSADSADSDDMKKKRASVEVKVESGSKLDHFDANNDGVVDENELQAAVEDSIRDKELNKLFKHIIYSLVILVIVLVGSLTYMTITVVELSKDSEVDDDGDRSVLRVKGGTSPVITGQPVSDGSSVNQSRFDMDLMAEMNATLTSFQSNRRLSAAPNANASHWYMSGTISRGLAMDGCQLLADGYSTYKTRLQDVSVDPLNGEEMHFLTMHTVDIKGATGCNGMSRLIVYFDIDGDPAEVKCPLDSTQNTCGVYEPSLVGNYNETAANYNETVADGYVGEGDRRLSDDAAHEEMHFENGWDDEQGQRRQLGAYLYMDGDPVCFLTAYPSGAYYKWCTIPYLSTAKYYLRYYMGSSADWVINMLEYMLRAYGMYNGNSKACMAAYNVYPWAKPVKTCRCSDDCDCFPSHAVVEVEGEANVVRMDKLKYGDRVKSVDSSSGGIVYRPVYLFGHADHDSKLSYVNLETVGNSSTTLQLSPTHFAVRCVANCDDEGIAHSNFQLEEVLAKDVHVGDMLLQVDGNEDKMTFVKVSNIFESLEQGLFNPYVRGGHVVVNGVAASVHSKWLFGNVSFLQQCLPTLYETILFPVYLLFLAIGPANSQWLAGALGVHAREFSSMDIAKLGLVYVLVAAGPLSLATLTAKSRQAAGGK